MLLRELSTDYKMFFIKFKIGANLGASWKPEKRHFFNLKKIFVTFI